MTYDETLTPPGSLLVEAESGGISSRQAATLLERRLRVKVPVGKVERVLRDLVREGRLAERKGDVWALSAELVDVVEGELWRRGSGWARRANVRGDFDAWVEVGGGKWRRLRLPYSRTWNDEKREEDVEVPATVTCHEWPTGRWTGNLVREGERHGLPAYVLRARQGDG